MNPGWLVALCLLGVLLPSGARASCAAPHACTLAWVRVETCTAFDPEQHPHISRYVEILRKEKALGDARRVIQNYRGVRLTGVVVETNTIAECRVRPRKDDLKATVVGSYRRGEAVVLHAVTSDAAGYCAKVTAKAGAWRVFHVPPCCDGDPGFPCMLRGGGSL